MLGALKLAIVLVIVAGFVTADVAMDTDDVLRQLTEFRREMADMKHKYELSQVRIGVLEETVAEMSGKCKTIHEVDSDWPDTYNTTDLEERVADLEMIVVELDEDIDNIDADINILQADVSDMDADIENIELHVDVEEDTSETHSEQIAALQLAYEFLTQRLEDIEQTQNVTYIELNERLTTVETSTDQHQADITQLYDVTNRLDQDLQGVANFSFLATISTNELTVADGEIIVFDEVRFNQGENYNPLSGEFTIPVDGVYFFTVHILSNGQTHGGCLIRVDGVRAAFTRQRDELEFDHPMELTVLLELTAGQIVDVENDVQTSIHGTVDSDDDMMSWFTGYLVKAQ